MNRFSALIAACAAIAATSAVAANHYRTLHNASPGQWELSGLPTSRAPVKHCVANLDHLLTLEHRGGKGCKLTTLSDDGTAMKVQFTCAGGAFGTTSLRVITPRSLRIDTQGIADNAPYSYVVQARRTGDCPSGKASERGH